MSDEKDTGEKPAPSPETEQQSRVLQFPKRKLSFPPKAQVKREPTVVVRQLLDLIDKRVEFWYKTRDAETELLKLRFKLYAAVTFAVGLLTGTAIGWLFF